MSKATFTPAKTETKTIELEPAKVHLELTVREAQVLFAVVSKTTGHPLMDLYRQLKEVHRAGDIQPLKLVGDNICLHKSENLVESRLV